MEPIHDGTTEGGERLSLLPTPPARAGTDGDADAEAVLLDAARRGEAEAITELYRRLQPRLLRILRVDVGDAADDVASQTWLEVMGALRRFEGSLEGFRALLFTIARRRVADHRRTQRRRPATPTAPTDLHDHAEADYDVEAYVLAELAGDVAVRRITELLPPEQAEVILLRIVADLPVDQVAEILGRPPGTVRVQQHRALKRLAAALARNGEAPRGDGDGR